MTDEMTNLARRAVACRHWRWMPGMLIHADGIVLDGGRVVRWHEGVTYASRGKLRGWMQYCEDSNGFDDSNALPDFNDPATLGCLLALVREAWKCADAFSTRSWGSGAGGYGQWVVKGEIKILGRADSESAALVAALEAAPVE